MDKYRIRRMMEELIMINIKENMDYYFEDDEYFRLLKRIISYVNNEYECYELISNDKLYKKLMQETINDIKKLPYIYDFRYFSEENFE